MILEPTRAEITRDHFPPPKAQTGISVNFEPTPSVCLLDAPFFCQHGFSFECESRHPGNRRGWEGNRMIVPKQYLAAVCLLTIIGLLMLCPSGRAQSFSHLKLNPKHVQWADLAFHAKNFWVEVSTRLKLKSVPAADVAAALLSSPTGAPVKTTRTEAYQMAIHTTIDPTFRSPVNIHNSIWFNPENTAALGRVRLRRGDEHFKKMYRFTDQGVFRHRVEPKNKKEASLEPAHWTAIKDSFYPYDLTRTGCPFVSERSLLVFILSAADFSKNNDPLSLCVFGKRQLHRVQLQAQGLHPLNVNYIEKTQQATIRKQGTINTLKIAITAEPMDSVLKEAENFSFLGFHDNIVIYIEPVSRLPIQAGGVIPTIGAAQLQLNEVVWKLKSE